MRYSRTKTDAILVTVLFGPIKSNISAHIPLPGIISVSVLTLWPLGLTNISLDARDNPPHTCQLNYPDDCTAQQGGGCIISAIRNQTELFVTSSSGLVRQEAFKFVIHLIGDLHQPLHTEDYLRGGNGIPVCWHNACARTNLHGVWDTQIPMTAAGIRGHPNVKQARINAERWAGELIAQMDVADLDLQAEGCVDVVEAETCTVAWAKEINRINCDYVFQPSIEQINGTDLSGAYFVGAKPIVEHLVGKAGVRLAAWIESMVKETENRRESLSGKLEFR
jgi:hypothetical protein